MSIGQAPGNAMTTIRIGRGAADILPGLEVAATTPDPRGHQERGSGMSKRCQAFAATGTIGPMAQG
jgi:hypothetical protein